MRVYVRPHDLVLERADAEGLATITGLRSTGPLISVEALRSFSPLCSAKA